MNILFHGLLMVLVFLVGCWRGWTLGRKYRPRELPPTTADDLERLEPHHSTSCDLQAGIWRCGSYCDANAWRKKNAGRPIMEKLPDAPAQLPVAKIARDMAGATVIDLKRHK